MGNINFQDYLLRNEKWLANEDEAKGTHKTDGKLDADEISVFFSGSHLELDSDSSGDKILSGDEFENWYSANESAISSYLKDVGGDYNDDESKKSMLDSMLDFIDAHSETIAKNHGKNGTKLKNLDTSELSGKSIDLSHAKTTKRFGKEYIESAKDALTQWDYNGDGKTSAKEMSESRSNVYANVFKGNDEFSKKAQEIAFAQDEIYAKYAGDDGILDEYEYVEALNSKENNALLEQYWDLKDEWEALKDSNKAAENSQKAMDSIKETLSYTGLNKNQQKELLNLYSDLANAENEDARASISAKIKEKTTEYGVSDFHSLYMEQDVMYAQENNQLQHLYEQLAAAVGDEAKDAIQAEIKELSQEYNQKYADSRAKITIETSDISKKQKNELNDLVSAFKNAGSTSEKDSILAELKEKMQRYGVSEEDSIGIERDLKAFDFSSEMQELYSELQHTDNENARNSILAEIKQKETEYNKMDSKMLIEQMIAGENLSRSQKAELNDLYSELTEADGIHARNAIYAEIKQKIQDYGVSERSALIMDRNALSINRSRDLESLYSQLSKATTKEERDSINSKIEQTEENYNKYWQELKSRENEVFNK